MSDDTLLLFLMVIPLAVTMGLIISRMAQSVLGGRKVSPKEIYLMEGKLQELQQRVENLETIITSIDSDLLEGVMKMQNINNPKSNQQKAQRLANSAESKSDIPLDENFKMILNKILMKVDSFLDEKK